MTKEYAIRMLADIFIPVGDRQTLIDNIYELIDDAKVTKEMLLRAQNDLIEVKDTTATILAFLQVSESSLTTENEPLEESKKSEENEAEPLHGYTNENQVVEA